MELTPEQAAILETAARDVAVSAGAGSGKTFVLVERYIRLLEHHRIPEIAAVTFTEAAATEMRERVRRAVTDRAGLAAHRRDLDDAVIGTIHALCLQILREHPVEARIDPTASVLADDENELLLLEACHEAIEAAAESGDDRTLALREIGIYPLQQALPRMVARRDEVLSAYEALVGDGPAEWSTAAHQLLDEAMAAAVAATRAPVAERLRWLEEQRLPGSEDKLGERLDAVLAAIGDPTTGDWQDWTHRLQQAADEIDLRGGSKKNWRAPVAEVRTALRSVREAGEAIAELPQWSDHDAPAFEAIASLQALFTDACARHTAAKRERHALDFLDLELEAVRLLREHPGIASAYQRRFRHLMVDEVQDTNPVQIELVRLLIGDRSDARAPHLFLVGDTKQSIYRFRGADVRQFHRLRAAVDERGGEILPLSRSFRTHDALVAHLNTLFGHVFAEAGADFEARMEPMAGRGDGAPASPHLVLAPIAKQTVHGSRANETEKRRVEADYVAATIAGIVGRGQPVWDRDREETRPARPGDIAILLRRLSNVHSFEQALEAHGVPYTTPSGAGFFTRQEVRDLTSLLTWLAEPDDAIALVGVLRSPLFLLDDPTLLALREHRRSLMAALHDPPDGLAPPAQARCAHAAAVLADLRTLARTAAPSDVLEAALTATAVEAAWAPLQGGTQAVANIRKLARLVRTLAGHSIRDIATYLARRRDELTAREGLAVVDRGDAVQLMTVHAAKGLEFPIVFVPEAHVAARTRYEEVRWRAEDGVGVTLTRPLGEKDRRRPGFYRYLLDRDEAEQAAEHKRLFYVAATRAADMLILSGDDAGKGGWLELATEAFSAGGDPTGLDIRDPAAVDLAAIAQRPPPRAVTLPEASDEVDYLPPLLARPRVIPVRASMPVTALYPPVARDRATVHRDDLGALRGRVAHRAIELTFTTGTRPGLPDLIRAEQEHALAADRLAGLAEEITEMLDRFDASGLARILRDPETQAHFELPFAWDWAGVPVHGTIDLAYREGTEWHVVDFKTDRVAGRNLDDLAKSYLPQLGLYGSALQRAVGKRPTVTLHFLRNGAQYTAAWESVDAALLEARARVDAGGTLDPASSEYVAGGLSDLV